MCQIMAAYRAAKRVPSPPEAQSSTGTVMMTGRRPSRLRRRHPSGSRAALWIWEGMLPEVDERIALDCNKLTDINLNSNLVNNLILDYIILYFQNSILYRNDIEKVWQKCLDIIVYINISGWIRSNRFICDQDYLDFKL